MTTTITLPPETRPGEARDGDAHVARRCSVAEYLESSGHSPFEGLMPARRTLILESQTGGGLGTCNASVIGCDEGSAILIRPPRVNGEPMFLRDGTALEARFFSGKCLIRFNTTVLKYAFQPFQHVHLGFPKEVTVVPVRATERREVSKPAVARRPHGGPDEKLTVIVRDLSVLGARVDSKMPLGDVGMAVELSMALDIEPGEPPLYVTLKGEIRRSQPLDAGAGISTGLKFQDLSGLDRLAVRCFLAREDAA